MVRQKQSMGGEEDGFLVVAENNVDDECVVA